MGPQVVYVTNLPIASNKLILPDGVTVADLQKQQQDLGQTSAVTSCPTDTPYYNGNTCISCGTGLLFDVTTLTCTSCGSGQSYNQTTHKCVTITYYSNLTNINWTSTNPDNVKKTAQTLAGTPGSIACPSDTPFYDGTKCIGCTTGQYFNFDGLKC